MDKDRIKGKMNQAVGGAREKAGDITGNEKMEAEGTAQKLKGHGQETIGKAKDGAREVADKVSD